MTGADLETGINTILDNTPQRGVAGSAGITKTIFKQIVAVFKNLLNDVNTLYDAGLYWRGAWSAATAYVVRDVVSQNGSTYRCKVAHTNQAVTNVAFWDLVAAKGVDGANGTDSNLRYGNSLLINGAGERKTAQNWSSGNYSNELIFNTSVNNLTKVYVDTNFVYKLKGIIHAYGSQNINAYILCFDKNDIYLGAQSTPAFVNPNNVNFSIFISGNGLAWNNMFPTGTDYCVIAFHNGTNYSVRNLVFEKCNLSDPVPNDLSIIPVGQIVYNVSNHTQLGRKQSDGAIAWISGTELCFEPNGTGVVYNLRRPYKFSWAILYNNGVTVVSAPAATIAANTDASLSVTGTAGKTITIVIYQTV